MPAKALFSIVVLAALLAAALWWGRDRASAPLGLWPALSRPALGTTPAAARARKCAGTGGVVSYTDVPCPSGQREQPMDGGTVSVLPAAPSPTTAQPTAGPASTPSALRRLAGDGAQPSAPDRIVDQALQR